MTRLIAGLLYEISKTFPMPITTPKQQMTEMTYIKTSKEPTKKHTMPKERSSPPTLVAPWIRRQQMIHSL